MLSKEIFLGLLNTAFLRAQASYENWMVNATELGIVWL